MNDVALAFLCITAIACSSSGRLSPADVGAGRDAASDPSDAMVSCVPGRMLPCACTDGRAGAQRCDEAGVFEPCVCGSGSLPEYCRTTPPRTESCAAVDMLFVVDNSLSMDDDQARLAAAFPSFVEGLREQLEGVDTHLMVVDTDGDTGRGVAECAQRCEWAEDFEAPEGCEGEECMPLPLCPGFDCISPAVAAPCDRRLGAGSTLAFGLDAPNQRCVFSGGRSWTTLDDPGLESSFTCAASVGTAGSGNEQVLGSVLAALAEEGAGPAGCNEGFFRPDALLVVVILSDASAVNGSEEAEAAEVDRFVEELNAIKCNDPAALVMLGLVGDGDTEGGVCTDVRDASTWLRDVVDAFGDRGLLGSICEPDYAPLLRQAVGLIDARCDLI